MEQRFNFSTQPDKVWTAPTETKKAFGEHQARVGGTVPWDIQHAAAVDLAREAQALMFSTPGRTYEEAANLLMANNPWLACARAAISDAPDRAARDLGIVDGGAQP